MTTIYETHSAMEKVPAGGVLTVTAPVDGSGFVQRIADLEIIEEEAIENGGDHTFGPYSAPMTFRIGCDAVSLSFSQAAATQPLMGLSTLTAADAGATAMLISADDLTNMVLLKVGKVRVGGVDYYVPLFGAD